MTELYFVRHCEPERVGSGGDNFSRQLTAKGQADTAFVTSYLERVGVEHVISSPYLRAVQTVAPFADKHGLRIEKAFDLAERRLDIVLTQENFLPFIRHQWEDFDYREADGECLREVERRCVAAVEDIVERFPMGRIAIGGHGTAISTIIHHYAPEFGFSHFMQLVDVMPFVAHMSFFGERCEGIEIIDPCQPLSRQGRAMTGELYLAEPQDTYEDNVAFDEFYNEFYAINEFPFGSMLLEHFDDIGGWRSWLESEDGLEGYRVYFAKNKADGRLVGIMSMPPAEVLAQDGGTMSGVYFSVSLSERWKGYGAQMLLLAAEEAQRRGMAALPVVCDCGNMAARKTIESAGGVMEKMLIDSGEHCPSGISVRYLIRL